MQQCIFRHRLLWGNLHITGQARQSVISGACKKGSIYFAGTPEEGARKATKAASDSLIKH